MFRINNVYKRFIALVFALTVLFGNIYGIGAVEVFAASENPPTIQMGDNAPMTRAEFMEWRGQRDIRHFSIDGRIYPAGIFFDWAQGQSFSCGELNDGILVVVLRPTAVVENSGVSAETTRINEYIPQERGCPSPVIFADTTPILLSYGELTAMIESVQHQNPLDTRNAATLPNSRLTESELEAWISEYQQMGGTTAFELSVVREINWVREQHGLRPLALDPALMMSARLKTQEFGDLQYFAHRSPVNGSPTETARMFGFDGWGVAETITRSGRSSVPVFSATPEGIVRGMLASTRGHREVLLNPDACSVGFGSFFSPNSTGPNNDMSHMFYFAVKFGLFD